MPHGLFSFMWPSWNFSYFICVCFHVVSVIIILSVYCWMVGWLVIGKLERMWKWSPTNLRSWIWHLPGEVWVNLTIVGVLTKIWTERRPDMSKVLLFEPLWFVPFHYNSLHFRTVIQSCLQSHFKISYRIFLCLAVRILWLFVCTPTGYY
jgi:hypothetical protein